MSARRLVVVMFVVVSVAIAFAMIRARRSSCVSYERGLRGEAKRGQDGRLVYFNGQCWTHEPAPPTDTPL